MPLTAILLPMLFCGHDQEMTSATLVLISGDQSLECVISSAKCLNRRLGRFDQP